MKTRNLFVVTLTVVLVSSWLSIVLLPSTQSFMNTNTYWNGVYEFKDRFNADASFLNARLTGDPGPILAGTEVNVLVVIPALPFQPVEVERMRNFVMNGGTLLVMDDFGYGNQLFEALGLTVRFAGLPLLDPYLDYRNQFFPVITDVSPEMQKAGIKQLILNHPSALLFNAGTDGYSLIARSSDTSFLDYNGDGHKGGIDVNGPYAVAASTKIGSGTVIAFSGPSILVNSMVRRGDNEKFIAQLLARPDGVPHVALDQDHLPKAPLDVTKDAWESIRERLSLPYVQVLLVSIILVLSFMSIWSTGAPRLGGTTRPPHKILAGENEEIK